MNWDSALRPSRAFALLVTTALALAVLGSPGVARAQGYNVVYSFVGLPGGAVPHAALIQGIDGNFYGTTAFGGRGLGTVFQVTPDGTETIVYAFTDSPDARFPAAALIQATDGSFYGTTPGGGAAGQGTIFQITPLLAQRNGP